MEQNEIKNEVKKTGLKNKFRSFFGQEFFRNSLIHWVLIGTAILNIANWILLAIFIRPVDILIILHYNVYFGVDIVGDWWQVFFLPGIGLTFFFVNFILAYFFYKQKERIASYLFLLASFIIQAGIIIASASIVIINY